MSNLVQGLTFSLSCQTDFSDRQVAEEVVSVLLNAPQMVRPRKYGQFAPDQRVEGRESLVRMLANERASSGAMRAGSLVAEASRDCGFQVQWNKGLTASFPFIGGHLSFAAIEKTAGILDDFLKLVEELVKTVQPVYGEVRSMAVQGWDAPMNLHLRLPDVPNISIYGQPYVALFGREKIESAPFVELRKVDDCYWLTAHAQLTEGVPAEVRSRIRQHLGEQSFMADGHWKYANGVAPSFDLSKVTNSG